MTTEYFFLLELVRPLLFWIVLKEEKDQPHLFKSVIQQSLPYLSLFLVPIIWRIFFFEYQTHSYAPVLLEKFQAQPWQTFLDLIQTITHDLWMVTVGAWQKALTFPDIIEMGRSNWMRFWIIVITIAIGLGTILHKIKDADSRPKNKISLQVLSIGLFALFIAGWPFWVTNLPLALSFPNSRFTLSFMLGSTLVLAALINLLSRWRWLQTVILGILLALAVGLQFQIALDYRVDWNHHTRMFWQMSWRIPALEKNTAVIGNYFPSMHYSDNSLSAPLNMIYAPGSDDTEMAYMYYFPELRKEMQLANFVPDLSITHDYLVATFHGNTSQVVSLYYHPRFCLRVLDPELDTINPLLSEDLQKAAALSSTQWIYEVDAHIAAHPSESIFGPEPSQDSWCYAFERADLARQKANWQQAAEIINLSLQAGLEPRTPSEWLLPIEAAAMSGDWQTALLYSEQAMLPTYAEQPSMQPVICHLWERIDRETPSEEDKQSALKNIQTSWNCNP
ncbi:MAG: hypothetical protein JEZ06_23910 [Anaerolineaceae bacterium]|nr:hypothetical protein [Anaerolineaceae bacterium]